MTERNIVSRFVALLIFRDCLVNLAILLAVVLWLLHLLYQDIIPLGHTNQNRKNPNKNYLLLSIKRLFTNHMTLVYTILNPLFPHVTQHVDFVNLLLTTIL